MVVIEECRRTRTRWTAIACVLATLVVAAPFPATAIVTRHDVAASRYLVPPGRLPALVDLPMEGHGVLIGSRWVLTAAHAVKMMRTMANHDYVTIAGARRHVSRIVLYPDYLASAARWDQLFARMKSQDPASWLADYAAARDGLHDIALIELAQPVDDVAPMPLFRGSGERGRIAALYGKGATGTDVTGAPDDAPHRGALRMAFNRVDARGQWLSYKFDCGRAALPLEGVIGGGDSGGPVLIEDGGKWKVAGLAHGLDGGMSDLMASRAGLFRSGTCGQRFISSRVSFFAPWIDRVMSGADEAEQSMSNR